MTTRTASAGVHTPGPWSVGYSEQRYKDQGSGWWEVAVHVGEAHNHGNAIAVVYLGGHGATNSTKEAVEANARLIAAAPTLLDALTMLHRIAIQSKLFFDPDAREVIDQAWAAIKLAGG